MIIKIPQDIEIPLIGLLHIGVIDRGSNLLQVRPTTICNLHCQFCSTGGGRDPECNHPAQFLIDPKYLVKWTEEVIRLKEGGVREINIDSSGEPTTHPELIKLVDLIKKLPEVEFISIQTNGYLLTKDKIKQLEKAGLNRINLSIHSLDKEKAKELSGTTNYDISKIKQTARDIQASKIELSLAPVWIPKINDGDMVELIKFAKELNCKIAIQKYEEYKYTRKMKGAKKINWFKFYRQLTTWEKEYNIKLKLGPTDYNLKRTKKIPLVFQRGDKVRATVICKSWLKNEMIAIANNRAIILLNSKNKPGEIVNVKILETKNSIYIAK